MVLAWRFFSRKHEVAQLQERCQAGGEPSTWFPLLGLVEQSGMKEEIYTNTTEAKATNNSEEAAGIDQNNKTR